MLFGRVRLLNGCPERSFSQLVGQGTWYWSLRSGLPLAAIALFGGRRRVDTGFVETNIEGFYTI